MCILKSENYSIGMKREEPGSLELFPLAYLPKSVDLLIKMLLNKSCHPKKNQWILFNIFKKSSTRWNVNIEDQIEKNVWVLLTSINLNDFLCFSYF